MSAYSVCFVRSARKEFDRLPAKLRSKIAEALSLLSQNPYSELLKVKKLKGADQLYRIRIGDHRVVYEVRNTSLVVVVIKIGHRSEIYRGL
ncbi:MAG: type II toxin-antitoxin system RelE/ParE family toxin [Acidobacteria bacterium]|nr:type II toxin-antitoxin system RelE/ParE family toxin [Acidobacteriota bacterium]